MISKPKIISTTVNSNLEAQLSNTILEFSLWRGIKFLIHPPNIGSLTPDTHSNSPLAYCVKEEDSSIWEILSNSFPALFMAMAENLLFWPLESYKSTLGAATVQKKPVLPFLTFIRQFGVMGFKGAEIPLIGGPLTRLFMIKAGHDINTYSQRHLPEHIAGIPAGFATGMAEGLISLPFDVIRTNAGANKTTGLAAFFQLRQNGQLFPSLVSSYVPGALNRGTFNAMYFSGYNLLSPGPRESLSPGQIGLIGMCAGSAAALVGGPFEATRVLNALPGPKHTVVTAVCKHPRAVFAMSLFEAFRYGPGLGATELLMARYFSS